MLTVSAKILAGKRCDFSWPHTTTPHPPMIQATPMNKN